ncbi:hypothetical protein HRG_004121 [Hirsutella rhossiliensis]|uniref:Uncharacterized protein n=1 Tax=Hirsutella rhossiliensis TaxID=111463 RepID=A0A9P8N3A7_9HYPO|nr:uncharacterized protein HRG_04121 [Hirsutella rhossiliensis]KAH0966105.1 hypothetical protein HRG_04121 [Hirsutella rhossiliensis]
MSSPASSHFSAEIDDFVDRALASPATPPAAPAAPVAPAAAPRHPLPGFSAVNFAARAAAAPAALSAAGRRDDADDDDDDDKRGSSPPSSHKRAVARGATRDSPCVRCASQSLPCADQAGRPQGSYFLAAEPGKDQNKAKRALTAAAAAYRNLRFLERAALVPKGTVDAALAAPATSAAAASTTTGTAAAAAAAAVPNAAAVAAWLGGLEGRIRALEAGAAPHTEEEDEEEDEDDRLVVETPPKKKARRA